MDQSTGSYPNRIHENRPGATTSDKDSAFEKSSSVLRTSCVNNSAYTDGGDKSTSAYHPNVKTMADPNGIHVVSEQGDRDLISRIYLAISGYETDVCLRASVKKINDIYRLEISGMHTVGFKMLDKLQWNLKLGDVQRIQEPSVIMENDVLTILIKITTIESARSYDKMSALVNEADKRKRLRI